MSTFVTGAPNWHWITVGQGLLSLQQVRVEGECCYFFCFFSLSFISFFFPVPLSFLTFPGRQHKMTHKGSRVVKPQHIQSNEYPKAYIFVEKSGKCYLRIPVICRYAEWVLKLDNIIRQPKFDKDTSWLRYELTKVRVDQKWVRID